MPDFEVIKNFILEDWVGLLINLAFAVMLIPALADKQKPPLTTSLVTGLLLVALSVSGSYRAAAPAVAVFVAGCMWLVLAWQRYRQS